MPTPLETRVQALESQVTYLSRENAALRVQLEREQRFRAELEKTVEGLTAQALHPEAGNETNHPHRRISELEIAVVKLIGQVGKLETTMAAPENALEAATEHIADAI